MLKLNQKIDSRIAYAVIALAIAIAVAVPALAGTVYSWHTLEGSQAFTDDAKRIPARYRDDAERQTVGRLEEYSRYTSSQISAEGTYRERLGRRLEQLREVTGAPETATAMPKTEAAAPEGFRLGVPVGSGKHGRSEHISLPIAAAGEDEEVIVGESVRLKRDPGHITTRHATKVLLGDRLILIRKADRNDTAPREWEADPAPAPEP